MIDPKSPSHNTDLDHLLNTPPSGTNQLNTFTTHGLTQTRKSPLNTPRQLGHDALLPPNPDFAPHEKTDQHLNPTNNPPTNRPALAPTTKYPPPQRSSIQTTSKHPPID
ncbi:hypothetical protein CesoFtcFv8_026550 [Champsocephalus esox]|uniref:Uncharacterized protein n=1 Tax=Champsocephalus esox TaxID=159716 RepID=A0AAN8AZD1_9TELE|nr:hypothetical protein CesoFtcFv8_026550 [Champsocephalus esox]